MMMVAPVRLKTPTAGLEILLGIPPLAIYIQQLAVTTSNRLSLLPNGWTGRTGRKLGHIAWLASIANIVPERELQDKCIEHCDTRKFAVTIEDGSDVTDATGIRCYTDGSGRCRKNGSGLAVYKNDNPEPIHTDAEHVGEATVFQAELHAITMACTFAQTQTDQKITILCDCQAAIKAVYKPMITSRTVLQAVTALNTLADSGRDVQVRWIKGHNDCDGNELADYMAKSATADDFVGTIKELPLATALLREAARAALHDRWTRCWHSWKPCRQTKIWCPDPDPSLPKTLLGEDRKNLGLLLRHFTGFSRLNYPRSLMEPDLYPPECRLCGDDREESAHIIRECPALTQSRIECLWTPVVEEFWFVHGVLSFLKLPRVAALEDNDQPDPWPDAADNPPTYDAPSRAPSKGADTSNAGSLFSTRAPRPRSTSSPSPPGSPPQDLTVRLDGHRTIVQD
jgi:ribonuclease HI